MLRSTVLSDSTLFRVAVIGAGSIGREFSLHHFGQQTRTRVVSVIDQDLEAAERLAADIGAVQSGAGVSGRACKASVADAKGEPVPYATSFTTDLLGNCDMVYIGVPPSSHKDLVLTALSAGKHVLLEKPLASSAADADAIVAATEAAEVCGVFVGVNIGMRWNAALQKMRHLLQEESALHHARLSLHFVRWPRDWQQVAWCTQRADGGPWRECGTHYLFALQELGLVARRVKAEIAYADGPDGNAAEISIEGVIECACGLRVELSVKTDGTGLASDGDDHYELEVVCESGMVLQLQDFVQLRRSPPGGKRRWKQLVTGGDYGRLESIKSLVDDISDSYHGEKKPPSKPHKPPSKPPRITVREARCTQRVNDAVLSSNGEWVDVNYETD